MCLYSPQWMAQSSIFNIQCVLAALLYKRSVKPGATQESLGVAAASGLLAFVAPCPWSESQATPSLGAAAWDPTSSQVDTDAPGSGPDRSKSWRKRYICESVRVSSGGTLRWKENNRTPLESVRGHGRAYFHMFVMNEIQDVIAQLRTTHVVRQGWI